VSPLTTVTSAVASAASSGARISATGNPARCAVHFAPSVDARKAASSAARRRDSAASAEEFEAAVRRPACGEMIKETFFNGGLTVGGRNQESTGSAWWAGSAQLNSFW